MVHVKYGRCLVLLSVYMLGMVLGSAIMLSFDFKSVLFEPVRTARELPSLVENTLLDRNNEHMSLHRKQLNSRLSLDDTDTYIDHSLHKTSPFVAILPSNFTNLEQIASVYNTWAETVPELEFFLPNNTNLTEFYSDSIFVRNLPSSPPPSSARAPRYSSIAEIMQVLRHLNEFYSKTFQYFLIISDTSYVNYFSFTKLVDKIHAAPSSLLYAGLPVQFGRTKYCQGDAGILLNSQTLSMLVSVMETSCSNWNSLFPWDKMLGQCIRRVLNINCMNISDDEYFIRDTLFQTLSPTNLWRSGAPYANALTISPVVSYEHMNTLHYFYTALQMKRYLAKAERLRKSVLSSCKALSNYAFESDIVKTDCESAAKDQGSGPVLLRYLRKTTKKRHFQYYQQPPWRYFDANLIYSANAIDPCIKIYEDKQTAEDIQQILDAAETVVQERYRGSDFKLKSVINGYIRQDYLKGNEYVIDALYNNSAKTINARVHLIRPLSTMIKVENTKDVLGEKIHIIVPVSNVNSKAIRYLNHFVATAIGWNQNSHLVLVVYRKLDFETIKKKVSKINNGDTYISVVRGKGRFSRSKALHQGMSTLKDSDLAFLCDVDIVVDPSFYDRCRRNSIRGAQVYFPSVVKLYNPKFFQGVKPYNTLSLNRQTGHWATYGYGMLCIYKSDYSFAGGLNIRMRGWGGEDIDFQRRVTHKGLTVFRAPDMGLVHHWHERDCGPRHVRKTMRDQCLSSKIEALGDKRTLARFIFNITERYPFLLKQGEFL